MSLRPTLLLLAVALALSSPSAIGAAAIQQPALTPQTASSGGPMPVEQTRVHFDHADLHFTLDIPHKRLAGDARLTFTATAATDAIVLDLDRNLPISQVTVDGQPVPTSRWSNPEGRLRVALAKRLDKGDRVTVGVRYAGAPHVAKNAPWDGGFVWAKTPSGQPWVATAVEGEGCDLFWPCIDQPTGKPDLVDTWVTVPKDLAAPGNGVLVGIEDHGATRTWHWRIKRPDTYAITINVGPFKELKGNYASRYGNTIPMEFWYLPEHEAQAKELFAGFTPMLDFFEQEIGPYPFGDEKMGVVETPHKGMEHQTINAYGNHYVKDGFGFDRLTEHGEPFPMPLDVQVGRTIHTLPMTDGHGAVQAAPGTLVIVDPRSKVLREMPHVEAFQQWLEQQKQARAKAGAKS